MKVFLCFEFWQCLAYAMQKRCSCVDKHACFDELTAKRDDVRGAAKQNSLISQQPSPQVLNHRPRRRPCPVVMTDCIISQPKRRCRQLWLDFWHTNWWLCTKRFWMLNVMHSTENCGQLIYTYLQTVFVVPVTIGWHFQHPLLKYRFAFVVNIICMTAFSLFDGSAFTWSIFPGMMIWFSV